ncbi:hypothetical protein [uncultured Tessaracoccus sp.]|uniref:hypothetical protein n=1 Tax=uncultured Tessaracoccus sp. TaxID=905023 RepID=UPI0025EAC786|nr:hypothetical protein [uncultured Tessaracoccus sp.]
MRSEPWQPVPLETTWGSLPPGAIFVHHDEDGIVVDVRRTEHAKTKLHLQRLNGERFTEDVKDGATVGQKANAWLHPGDAHDVRAVSVPAVLWRHQGLLAPRTWVGLLVSAVVGTAVVVFASAGQLYLAFLAAGAASVAVQRLFRRGNELQFLAPDRLGITMETILPYVLTREQGKLWVSPTAGADRRQLTFQRVDAIRERHLELREDIAYRIECSALFDPAVPATAEFEAALVRFDDVTDQTPTDELDALASEVEVSFNVAQANAERLGIAHLPEEARGDARRAGKAARLAAGASTEGERQASLSQVRRILDELALYYLPRLDETLAIEAGPDVTGSRADS